MPANRFRKAALALLGLCLVVPVASTAARAGGLKDGKPDLKSIGPLAFGPDGVLFVGDTAGAAIFAIDTGDKAEAAAKGNIEVKDVSGTIAKMLGTTAQQLMINDLAVNPSLGQRLPGRFTRPRAGCCTASRSRQVRWQDRGSLARENSVLEGRDSQRPAATAKATRG